VVCRTMLHGRRLHKRNKRELLVSPWQRPGCSSLTQWPEYITTLPPQLPRFPSSPLHIWSTIPQRHTVKLLPPQHQTFSTTFRHFTLLFETEYPPHPLYLVFPQFASPTFSPIFRNHVFEIRLSATLARTCLKGFRAVLR